MANSPGSPAARAALRSDAVPYRCGLGELLPAGDAEPAAVGVPVDAATGSIVRAHDPQRRAIGHAAAA
ncbi:hypothetical protein GCM10010428_43760 [Actinosynnema pretiosum subsp. pretiosum]